MSRRFDFRDHESNSAAFAIVERRGERVIIGIGVEANGDLDLALDSGDALSLAEQIEAGACDPKELLTWHLDHESVAMLRDALVGHAERGGEVGGLLETCDEWLSDRPAPAE